MNADNINYRGHSSVIPNPLLAQFTVFVCRLFWLIFPPSMSKYLTLNSFRKMLKVF